MMIHKYNQKRFDYMFQMLRKSTAGKRKLAILDVGGNNGAFYSYFIKKLSNKISIEYHLVDYDKKVLKIAQKSGIVTHYLDLNFDALNSVFSSTKKFDVIICTEVLEHLLNPTLQMERFRKLLKKDGVLLLSLPNENTIFHRIYFLLGLGVDSAFTLNKHLHLPTLAQGESFIAKNCSIKEKKYYVDFTQGNQSMFSLPGKLINRIPLFVWEKIAAFSPSLFARGTIFLGENKK